MKSIVNPLVINGLPRPEMSKNFYTVMKDDDHSHPGLNPDFWFTDNNYILQYLDQGCSVRSVLIPQNDTFTMYREGNRWRSNQIILGEKLNLSDPKTFRTLIKSFSVSYQPIDSLTLFWAIHYNHVPLACELISLNIDFEKDQGRCLKKAVSLKQHSVVKMILLKTQEGIEEALKEAIFIGELALVIQLTACLNPLDYKNLLVLACRHGHVPIIKWLLKKGTNPHENNLPMEEAIKGNHINVIVLLLQNRVPINVMMIEPITPLLNLETIKFLRVKHLLPDHPRKRSLETVLPPKKRLCTKQSHY